MVKDEVSNQGDTHSAFNTRAFFKPFCWVFQRNVRIMIGPYDAINSARKRNKESIVNKFFYCTLHDIAHCNIAHLQEFLLNDRRF